VICCGTAGGTYVKASTETNSDVGDKNNDAVRIDATDLRCRVVGGGTLGLTQRGASSSRAAAHINTDARSTTRPG
jgi:glutamate dehydrogenase